MKTSKVLAVIAALVIVMAGCSIDLIDTHFEGDDAGNGSSSTAEETGFVANGWYAIEGTISSVDDADYYNVQLPANSNWLDFTVYHNDEKIKGILGISLFPFHFVTYDDNGDVATAYLLQAAVGSQDLDPEAVSVKFNIIGSTDYPSGSYRIEFSAY